MAIRWEKGDLKQKTQLPLDRYHQCVHLLYLIIKKFHFSSSQEADGSRFERPKDGRKVGPLQGWRRPQRDLRHSRR